MAEVHRVLKPGGTFWLSIGDEFAAELKVAAEHKSDFTRAAGSCGTTRSA